MRRRWVKLWVDKLFELYAELPDNNARALFWGLLALAGDSPIPGEVCLGKNLAWTNEQIAQKLHFDIKMYPQTLSKLIGQKLVKKTEKNTLKIAHWEKYQSEYQRIKPYILQAQKGKEYTPQYTPAHTALKEVEVRSRSRSRSKKKEINNIQVDELINYWNGKPYLKHKIAKISGKRLISLQERLKDPFWIANWKQAIDNIEYSDFCRGYNERRWVANAEWFLRPDTVLKLIEGEYGILEAKKRAEKEKQEQEEHIKIEVKE